MPQTSSASNSKLLFGRFDPIHIALAVTTLIFLILSIVFIILFATKHDTSTAFLTTGYSPNSTDALSNDFQSKLKSKYTINSFALETQNQQVSAVYSLRGSVSNDDVQNVLSSSNLVSQLETTYGDKAYSVCHQQPLFTTTTTKSETTTQSQTTTQSVTTTPQITTSAQIINKYCNGEAIRRNVILVIDMDDRAKTNKTEKLESLNQLKLKIVSGVNFPATGFLLAAVVGGKVKTISTKFVNDIDGFTTDFNTLLNVPNFINASSLDLGAIMAFAAPVFPANDYRPGELIILTDKASGAGLGTTKNLRELGIYVAIAGVTYSTQYETFVDQANGYTSWTELANSDPFSDFICKFYNKATPPAVSRFYNYPMNLDAAQDSPTCQVLDILIAFDTSESLSRIIIDQYKTFAKKLVAQYKYNTDQYTRVGIVTFNNGVTEKLQINQGTNLDLINKIIDAVQYEGGLTDVTKTLVFAKNQFQQESDGSHGKILLVLSDAIPTVDTYADEIAAGKDLTNAGVATFFIGYSSFTDDVKKQLGQVTNPDYVFGDMSDATFNSLTNIFLRIYPCPLPKCVTAYFAIEISEATGDYTQKNLISIQSIVDKMAPLQTGTESYQLISYNSGMTRFNPQGDASLASFKTFLDGLINDPAKVAALRGGHTRLDTAIDDISKELTLQLRKNARFTSNILFFGQANNEVLDPDVPEAEKIALLKASSSQLLSQTGGLIYVVDDSRPSNLFGDDLWTAVTTADKVIPLSDDVVGDLSKLDYFDKWSKMSCQLPALATCYDTQLDIAVIFDLQKQDYPFMNYITQFVNRFSTEDDAHISYVAYGSQETKVLAELAAHSSQELANDAVIYEEWRNGSYFITTTTQAPTTSQKPTLFNNDYQITSNTISGLFDQLRTQFGCGNYNDNRDRLFAPNIFIIASDDLGNYDQSVWTAFKSEVRDKFGCWDCAGTPKFLFLSRNDNSAPVDIGVTINLSDSDLDIDATDDTSTQANINKFNNLVNTICVSPLNQCSSYTCYS